MKEHSGASGSIPLVTCASSSIKLWSPPNFELSREIVPPHPASRISNICYDHVKNRILSSNELGQGVVATDLSDDTSTLLTPDTHSCVFDLSHNCKYLLGGSSSGVVALLDLRSGKVKQTYEEHSSSISAVKISPKNHSVAASADKNGQIVCYNIGSGRAQKLHSPNQDRSGESIPVTALNFSPCRQAFLASGGKDGKVVFWDISASVGLSKSTPATSTSTSSLGGIATPLVDLHSSAVTSLSFSPVIADLLLTSSSDGSIVYVDPSSRSIVKRVQTGHSVTNSCLLCDGNSSAVSTEEGLVLMYDLRKLDKPVFFFTSHLGSPVIHLSQLTAPPSFSQRKPTGQAAGSGSTSSVNNDANNGGRFSSGFSSSGGGGFTTTSNSETESEDVVISSKYSPRVPLKTSGTVNGVVNASNPSNASGMVTPLNKMKAPLSGSIPMHLNSIGKNSSRISSSNQYNYISGSVFSPLESGYASPQEIVSSTKPLSASPRKFAHSIDSVEKVGWERSAGQNSQEPGTPTSPTSSLSLSQAAVLRQAAKNQQLQNANSNSSGSNASSRNVNGGSQVLTRKLPSSASASQVDLHLHEQQPGTSMTNGMTFKASSGTSEGEQMAMSKGDSGVSDAGGVDLLRKTVLESTESIKYTLQRELVKSQINSYNDFFQLKQMMEQLIAENQSMRREINELKESVNKLQARANLFS